MNALKVFFQQVGIFYKKFGVLPFFFLLLLTALAITWLMVEPVRTALFLSLAAVAVYLAYKFRKPLRVLRAWAIVIVPCVFFASAILAAVVFGIHAYREFPKNYYAKRYHVKMERVYVQPEPHDCEWSKSPLGNKYCHYDKTVEHSENGVVVSWSKVDE
jgi:hypothetical protein